MASKATQGPEIQRQDLEAAISKAVELRALHAALNHNTSSSMRLQPGASPSFTRLSTQLPAEDYPVFTPSYEDEQLSRYGPVLEEEASKEENDLLESLILKLTTTHRNNNCIGSKNRSPSFHDQMPISEDQRSTTSNNNIALIHSSPTTGPLRVNSEDLRSIVSRNPSSTIVTLPDAQQRNRAPILSWLLPRFRRKSKSGNFTTEDLNWGMDTLRKEVLLANENRDVALAQAGDMRASVEDLRQKLQHLESYCAELKKVLKLQAMRAKTSSSNTLPRWTMPVPHKAMVEGFLQMVSESRLSVRQFCKSLTSHAEVLGGEASRKLNSGRSSRVVVYQLEALVNRSLHQDFENCVYRRDGAPRELNPERERRGNLASFVALRNLSWREVMRKGTRCYSEELSGFCDRKMGAVAEALGLDGRWPEELLQSFFVAVKCVWLLHLLAFAFDPPLGIIRVEEGRDFDGDYMEDVVASSSSSGGQQAKVKFMVAPGFFLDDTVFKCRVLISKLI